MGAQQGIAAGLCFGQQLVCCFDLRGGHGLLYRQGCVARNGEQALDSCIFGGFPQIQGGRGALRVPIPGHHISKCRSPNRVQGTAIHYLPGNGGTFCKRVSKSRSRRRLWRGLLTRKLANRVASDVLSRPLVFANRKSSFFAEENADYAF